MTIEVAVGQKCPRCSAVINDGISGYGYATLGDIVICDLCCRVDYMERYIKTRRISSSVSMDATLAAAYLIEGYSMDRIREDRKHYYLKYETYLRELHHALEQIQFKVSKFDRKHWMKYLKQYYRDSTSRGHRAKVEDIDLLMWGSAGRVMITLDMPKDQVTMIFTDSKEDNECRGGYQSVDATAETANKLLDKVYEQDKIKFKTDDKVTWG